MCYDKKKVGNGAVSEWQGLASKEEDESRVDDAGINANNVSRGVIQVHDGLQIPQQQPQGPMICWERFLPVRSLKILLVENDDSTRHVVSALLRNCSYEVTAVANGLQAWNVLEDLTNHIDLVLTEVVMPVLSGIGLLCKIMSHKTFRTIPVIMMSSHDSMGLVFKCFSKGAVDFLVKPIRKNELKNLWQHVWRRCHSSSGSGSGSESGTQTIKSAKLKSNEESDNNTGSSDEHDNWSNDPSIRDGSDNGSGTQSSWTKKAVDIDCLRPLSPSYQFADAPDSNCAQVIHTRPGTFSNRWIHASETKECQEQDEQFDDATMDQDLEIGVSKNQDLQCEHQCENLSIPQTSKRQTKLPEVDDKLFDSEQLEHNNENLTGKLRDLAPNVSQIEKSAIPKVEKRHFDTPNGISSISQVKDKACSDPGEIPSLELTLTRPRGVGDDQNAANDDRNVLRHSNLSAFSKYNTASSAHQGPTGIVGSYSPLDNSYVAIKTEMMCSFPSHSSGTPLNQQSNGSSNNNDMASTAKYVTPKSEGFIESISAFKPFHSSALPPVPDGHISSSQTVLPEKADDVGVKTVQAQGRGSKKQVQVQHHNHHHHHHHHHYYHHHVPNVQQQQPQADHDDIFLKDMAVDAPQCGSSNMFEGPTEGDVVNFSVNGSASGSNHGSNGQNGNGTALNAEQMNVESDNGAGGNSRVDIISGTISGSGADEDRVALREAALTKFRQKRKERCFEKRVRYHSRKKLAEQRPRVRGQFVRRSDSR